MLLLYYVADAAIVETETEEGIARLHA